MHLEVAVPAPLPGTFTYEAEEQIAPGSRVLVPFGPRKMVGVVTGATAVPPDPKVKVKKIAEIIDDSPIYSPVIMEIAHWMSRYYLHPLGEVLSTMLPASTSKQMVVHYELTAKGEDSADPKLQALFKKKKKLAQASLLNRIKKLQASGDWEEKNLQDFVRRGLVRIEKGKTIRTRKAMQTKFYDTDAGAAPAPALTLTPSQQQAFEGIFAEPADTARPVLLWGLTGSGKTELYLQSLARIFEAEPDAQALMLVPEISLTPQMTRVFASRFPGKVAVVHSAMSDPQRWAELQRIRSGEARVLIGPRSAVFGPFQKLRIIIVDEEHDPSYKQTMGLTYNGRDIAVLRARLEHARIILGSATPSMESYQNGLADKYNLISLTERVSGKPLPTITVLQADPRDKSVLEFREGKELRSEDAKMAIAPEILEALRDNHAKGHQSIVIVNRRGYAYFLLSVTSKKAVACPQCSISLTVHSRSTLLRCHYCDYQVPLKKIFEDHPGERFITVGYGSQQAEDYLRHQIPGARIVRVDSDTTAKKDSLQQTLADFASGGIDILVGTQILAKGHDFPRVTLIAILEVDQTLNLPDFRAGERTFQLVVQAAGRAGRDQLPGRVLIQTLKPDHPIIQSGAAQNFAAFAERELAFRRSVGYPPFTKLILLELNSEHQEKLKKFADELETWLARYCAARPELAKKLQILGPAVPPIEVIRLRHRRTVLFASEDFQAVWRVVRDILQHLTSLPGDIRMKIDVDPQTLV